jgi:hypothetical protein
MEIVVSDIIDEIYQIFNESKKLILAHNRNRRKYYGSRKPPLIYEL